MTDYWNANTINDLIRSIFAFLDKVAYWLLGIMYEILFNVAEADIFSNETIRNFYSRIQLIIGVFMLFKLAVSIIQGIIILLVAAESFLSGTKKRLIYHEVQKEKEKEAK